MLAPPQRLLEFRCGRYFYADGPDTFLPVPMVPRAFNARLAASSTALSATSDPRALEEPTWRLSERGGRYGPNEMAIPVRSVAALIADEMWHPFYVFQYFSIIIWVAGDSYITYAVCIFAITWFSIITSALETHANARRLADIAHFTCMVRLRCSFLSRCNAFVRAQQLGSHSYASMCHALPCLLPPPTP